METNLQEQHINQNWIFQFLVSSKYRLYRHILLILFSVVVLYYSKPEYVEPYETYSRIVMFFQVLLLSYFNMYLFVPRFLFKNKYVSYSVCLLVCIVIWKLVHQVLSYYFKPYLLPNEADDVNWLSLAFVILVLAIASAAIKLFQRWVLDAQLINELEKANANAELEQLKNQINPHFLFNTLNNANVLTKKDPEKASEVLMKLSDLLRYQLYDSARESVLLTSDIRFVEDFLNLEKVRRENFDFLISKEGEVSGVQIPPLLFISFVENAVKHNNDSSKASYVHVFFKVIHKELHFTCENSKPEKAAVSAVGGLGLQNIKRRLELLFPETHTLKIENNAEKFTVFLSIKL